MYILNVWEVGQNLSRDSVELCYLLDNQLRFRGQTTTHDNIGACTHDFSPSSGLRTALDICVFVSIKRAICCHGHGQLNAWQVAHTSAGCTASLSGWPMCHTTRWGNLMQFV